MVLGIDKLLELVKNKKLVEGLCKRELTNPEGCGFDLCLGRVHKLTGKGFMGLEERDSADASLISEFNSKKKQSIIINPRESYLVTTCEKVNLPQNITANIWLRSTLYRTGIIISGGNVAPGYSGELSFLLHNSGECLMEIELGARIVHILFYEVSGSTNSYRGQWSGGRVTSKKREIQV
jgi:deoxycytidine triphosphate deaminase